MLLSNHFHKELASTIRFHRKKSGLNQRELARLAGIGKTAVFDVEHGKKTVQLDTFIKILNVLNIRIELHSPLLEKVEE
ncbi:MAG: helix-turn-helix domain-containing protein [Deltaproteobacteria bacterium]|nr:helix-turn-helix domain-containing protein [Deltaproteobacteria bacterium]